MNDKLHIIGIDQGFSSVKVSTRYGEFKFSNSVQEVGQSGALFFASDSNPSTKSFLYKNKNYIVGDDATGKTDYYRDVQYLLNYAPLMLVNTLYQLKDKAITKHNIAALGIGLPLENVSSATVYRNVLREFEVNNEKYVFPKINCYAQGVGAYADYVYNWGQKDISSKEQGFVWDIGENTMILVSYDGFTVKKDGSRQYDKQGISAIYDIIRESVRQRIEREPTITDLRTILSTHKIKSFGEEIDCKDLVIPAIKKYLDITYNTIMDNYKEKFSRCDKVILAGGGSRILSAYIEQIFNKNKFFIMAPEPEYSNARGYRYILLKKIRKEQSS